MNNLSEEMYIDCNGRLWYDEVMVVGFFNESMLIIARNDEEYEKRRCKVCES